MGLDEICLNFNVGCSSCLLGGGGSVCVCANVCKLSGTINHALKSMNMLRCTSSVA